MTGQIGEYLLGPSLVRWVLHENGWLVIKLQEG